MNVPNEFAIGRSSLNLVMCGILRITICKDSYSDLGLYSEEL